MQCFYNQFCWQHCCTFPLQITMTYLLVKKFAHFLWMAVNSVKHPREAKTQNSSNKKCRKHQFLLPLNLNGRATVEVKRNSNKRNTAWKMYKDFVNMPCWNILNMYSTRNNDEILHIQTKTIIKFKIIIWTNIPKHSHWRYNILICT